MGLRSLVAGVAVLGACTVAPLRPQLPAPEPPPEEGAPESEAPPRGPRVEIRRLVAQPRIFASGDGPVVFEFEIPAAARRVSLDILDESGAVVRRIDRGPHEAGAVRVAWDGRAAGGGAVGPGVYLYRILAPLGDGRIAAVGETPQGGGEEVLPRRFTHDRDTGVFSFLLPQPARVRLRIGVSRFPLLRTLLDWAPLGPGRHELAWDGLDASGLLSLARHPKLSVHLQAFALPANALIVHGANGPEPGRVAGAPAYAPASGPLYAHARHPGAVCHEPAFRVRFPGLPIGPGGEPILDGVAPVRVELANADRAHLVNTRFEVMFFLDTVFLFEEEDGSSPFTYQLDTRGLAPGPHTLTVNVLAYDDHVGVQTLRFQKAEP